MLIFLFICLVYGSVTIGLLAMIANLTPILFILGCMGLTGVSLDYFRLLLATIAIGIAVDDTIHLLNRYKIEFACSGDYRVALERALMGVGPALITTTAILVVAFLSYLYSDLAVLSSFGLLLSGAVFSALIADLFQLPVLIMNLQTLRTRPRRGPLTAVPLSQDERSAVDGVKSGGGRPKRPARHA